MTKIIIIPKYLSILLIHTLDYFWELDFDDAPGAYDLCVLFVCYLTTIVLVAFAKAISEASLVRDETSAAATKEEGSNEAAS